MAKSKREIPKVPEEEKEELNLGRTEEPKPKHKLDGRLDEIIELIIDGHTYRTIAAHCRVSLSTLHAYLNLPEHSARAREALNFSASTYADKAEQVIIDVDEQSETGPLSFQKVRELAHHYRWKAAKRAPKEYGEKLDVTSKGEKVNNTIPNLTPEQIKALNEKPDGIG